MFHHIKCDGLIQGIKTAQIYALERMIGRDMCAHYAGR